MKPYLDGEKIEMIRNIINSTVYFTRDEEQKKRYNLLCTFLYRLNHAVDILTSKVLLTDEVGNPEDFILFLVYADIIIEAIKVILMNTRLTTTLKIVVLYLITRDIMGMAPTTSFLNT